MYTLTLLPRNLSRRVCLPHVHGNLTLSGCGSRVEHQKPGKQEHENHSAFPNSVRARNVLGVVATG